MGSMRAAIRHPFCTFLVLVFLLSCAQVDSRFYTTPGETSCGGTTCPEQKPEPALYVDVKTGENANDGTDISPMKDITPALNRAVQMGIRKVYVSEGEYNQTVFLVEGVSIYGGFSRDHAWQQDPATYHVVIKNVSPSSGPSIAVQGNNLLTSTVIANVEIRADKPLESGQSSYGVYCKKCPGLIIQNSLIYAADGANGMPGVGGSGGTSGMDGTEGQSTQCKNMKNAPGADGGMGVGSIPGGSGGAGGRASTTTNPNGVEGAASPAPSNIPGGKAGWGGFVPSAGGDGETEKKELIVPGKAGQGGKGGSVVESYWQSTFAGKGERGENGKGGGGGGGSGAYAIDKLGTGGLAFYYEGNGGGGGGGGGTGGMPGTGGQGGGGSFGVFVIDSKDMVLDTCLISSGNGGKGGDGGKGGSGGSGGKGKPGGNRTCNDGFPRAGGKGGDGSPGRTGGSGGGGEGGPSVALFQVGAALSQNKTTLQPGKAGEGGIAPDSTDPLAQGAQGLGQDQVVLSE